MGRTLHGISRKQEERNAITPIPAAIVVPKIRKHAPKEPKKWVARVRPEDEARAATYNTFHKPSYRPGDGDTIIVRRPGSDHSHLKSAGTLC